MNVLTPSPNPVTILTPTHVRALASALSPVLTNTLVLFNTLRALLSQSSIIFLFRTYWLLRRSLLISQLLLWTSSIVLYHSSILTWRYSFVMGKGMWWTTKMSVGQSWKRMAWLRKKLEYEFFVFILGGGNQVLLVVFWPGWLVVGGAAGGVWYLLG